LYYCGYSGSRLDGRISSQNGIEEVISCFTTTTTTAAAESHGGGGSKEGRREGGEGEDSIVDPCSIALY